ncbi:hypothetical protein [Dasania marina]|uniref:hypothetical protein n=1 Tax=Dasania marina TaxID=471499 RepID=UPI00036984DE|nr:hypothetical protein [Dasania marina]
MQIANSTISPQIPRVSDNAQRVLRDAPQRQQPNQADVPPTISESDSELQLQRRQELARAIAASRSANDIDQSLPRSSQQAIRAFESNKPTVEQQLGIELIGIDTYA